MNLTQAPTPLFPKGQIKGEGVGWVLSGGGAKSLGIKVGEEDMTTYLFGPSSGAGESQIGEWGRVEPGKHYPDNSLRTLCRFALRNQPLGILSDPK